ncbi:hypothetical protein GOV14_05050 [Candidatus Pacearchaeota archaeon]|nr:hypothetical protein [Candidatus Pacearchaeota archaeon]
MVDFIFGTKAETLKKIKPLVKESLVLDHLSFSVTDWINSKEEIIKEIIKFFDTDLIAIRSSSLNEDTLNSSQAGNYETILNVPKNDIHSIIKAVEKVKESYTKKGQPDPNDQILVQPMIKNVILSGVVFTRCHNTGAPYLVINYDDMSGKTYSVTGGSGNLKTFTYLKSSEKLPTNPHLNKVIKLVNEIETITNNDSLDIEFAINDIGIFLLQIRPLTTLKQIDPFLDENLKSTIKRIKEFIQTNDKKFPNLHGYKAIFGSMPDWNPAEIIGESPKPLAFSLYRELITDSIWPLSRKKIGYKDVGYHPGVVSLGGKPYVDVRLSFNTFVPASLSETTSEKLVNFYIDKLINNPKWHDKVEFKIAHTCYKFGFEKEEQELQQNNFSPLQIKEIKDSLIELTNKIVNNHHTSIDQELELNYSLGNRREKIVNSDIEDDVKISQLIHDCKYYGTLPFSKLARFAFIGNILLTSLVDKGVVTTDEKDLFFRSIRSVATEFLETLQEFKNNQITKEDFLKKFGHLRPGTYDLCSKTYNENFDEYFIITSIKEKNEQQIQFDFSIEKKTIIDNEIKKEGLDFSADQFLEFTRKALIARERSKFEFTKNLSLVLDYCHKFMSKHGFSKEDVTFLEINDIILFSHKSKSINEIEELKNKIKKSMTNYQITKALRLPPLIYLDRSTEYFHQFDSQPNYITNKSITGKIINLSEHKTTEDIKNKIVLITNADPGYDWIFGHNIKGLITKYGGVASHMSIRCAEFGLPAAIGCGETIFEHIRKFENIELNCGTNQIKGIS